MSQDDITTTQALVCQGETLPTVRPMESEPWDESMPRVLECGVDTVYFSFQLEVSEDTWARLTLEQQQAREIYDIRKAVYAPDWLGGIMATTGARGGYTFRIETDSFTVKLLKGIPNRPPIYVEMRSFALHTHPRGAQGACEDACAWIRTVLMADQPELHGQVTLDDALCSRLDLHADWQGGWHPSLHEAEKRLFLRPGRCDWHPFLSGNTCTGYRFGSGKVQARIYNKTIDVKKKHLDWYPVLLAQRNGAAFNPELDIWRLEFQLIRDGVKGFKLYRKPEVTDGDDLIQAELDREDLPTIGSVRKALHWASRLWAYLTRHWLRLVEEGEDTNRARWATHPTWELLQQGFDTAMAGAPLAENKLQLVRKERHTGYERFLHRISVGVLAMVEAQTTNAVEVAHAWLAHLAHCLDLAQANGEGGMSDQGWAKSLDAQRHLIGEVLGLFTSAGVAKSTLPLCVHAEDLVFGIIDDLERIALSKGGMMQMLLDKRVKLYKINVERFQEQMAA